MAKDSMKYYATGRRKTAVARVWVFPGEGKILINRREAEGYLMRPTNLKLVEQPLVVTGTREKYDVWATAKGGGLSGQAGAIRLGIARALLRVAATTASPSSRPGTSPATPARSSVRSTVAAAPALASSSASASRPSPARCRSNSAQEGPQKPPGCFFSRWLERFRALGVSSVFVDLKKPPPSPASRPRRLSACTDRARAPF
jgi:ribosomal protein S9